MIWRYCCKNPWRKDTMSIYNDVFLLPAAHIGDPKADPYWVTFGSTTYVRAELDILKHLHNDEVDYSADIVDWRDLLDNLQEVDYVLYRKNMRIYTSKKTYNHKDLEEGLNLWLEDNNLGCTQLVQSTPNDFKLDMEVIKHMDRVQRIIDEYRSSPHAFTKEKLFLLENNIPKSLYDEVIEDLDPDEE